MNPRVIIAEAADSDLAETFAFLAEHRGVETADRFYRSFRDSCATLLRMPSPGSPRRFQQTEQPHLADTRQWPVKKFGKYLIFYRSVEADIQIIRVLHSSRDIDSLLSADDE